MKVYTSIDMKWQQQAMDIIRSTTAPLNFGFKPSAALVAIDPANGYIRTMVGGLDYKKQKFNLASQAKRQAGSSMKPFVLATAVEQGMNPDTTYYSSKSPIIIPMGAYAAAVGGQRRRPRRARERVRRHHHLRQRRVRAAERRRRPRQHRQTAHKMGITSPLDAVPSITLGTSGVTPLEMADVYATLAAGGIHHRPQAIVQVKSSRGKVIWKPDDQGQAGHSGRRGERRHPVPRAGHVAPARAT